MQRQSKRRIIQSISAALMFTAGFIPMSASAQKMEGKTTSSTQHTVSVNFPEKIEAAVLADGRVVYNVIDQNAEYLGDLQGFLIANLRYPEEARKQKIQGKSIMKFIISSDGSVSDVEVARSSGNKLLDDEALRVTNMMGKWKPGVKDGQPVASFYHLPISFQLD